MSTLKSTRVIATKLKERIQKVIDESELAENKSKEGLADKLARYLDHYKSNREEIKELSVGPTDLELLENETADELDFFLDVEDKVFELRAREEKLKSNNGGSTSSSESSGNTRAKLPKLELQTFSGNMLDFTAYWASFINNVDKRTDLSVNDKFAYLTMSLKDGSGSCIAGLERSEENYEKAKARISNRYGDKQARISAHFRALNDIKVASANTASLRLTYDSVEVHLGNLESLGEGMASKSILECIRSKFPTSVLIALEESMLEGESMSIELFRTKLHRFISVREKCEGFAPGDGKVNVKQPPRQPGFFRSVSQPNTPFKSTTGSYVTGASSPSQPRKGPPGGCIFCDGPHWNDDCTAHPTIAARKNRIKGRCFCCFSSNHTRENCTNVRACRHCGAMDHHRSLCEKYLSLARTTVNVAQGEMREGGEVSDSTLDTLSLVATATRFETFLPATSVCVSALGEPDRFVVQLLMDTGAQATFISRDVARRLGLRGEGRVKMNLFRFGSDEAVSVSCAKVKFKLHIRGGWLETQAIVVPFITRQTFSEKYFTELQAARRRYPNLPINGATKEGEVGVLVGSDLYYYLTGPRLLSIRPGLFLTETRFGFLLVGKERDSDFVKPSIVSLTVGLDTKEARMKRVDFDLKRFWDLDVIGIGAEVDFDDDSAVCRFSETVIFENSRYWVSWPWRRFPPDLPDNFGLAKGRLRSLISRLRTERRLELYDKTIQEQLSAGVIEKLESRARGLEHYLPHRHVWREGKTTKLRVVFDASSKSRKGVNSLNDCLFRGRVILEDQVRVLMRFRRHAVAVTADIEKAFLQLGLRTEDDMNVVRFLWLKNLQGTVDDSNLQLMRFRRVVFGVNSSPFLLNAVVRNHVNGALANYPELANLLSGLYVDNLALSLPDREQIFKVYLSSRQVFKLAGMNLREWFTHDAKLKAMAREAGDYIFKGETEVGVLGYMWDCVRDELRLGECVRWVNEDKCTKRAVASFVSSIYDPMGFIGPVSLAGKLLLRKSWLETIEWDANLSNEFQAEWVTTCATIYLATSTFRIPRWSVYHCVGTSELHCFVDASQQVYAACLYVRSSSDGEIFHSNLVISKNRLGPLTKQGKPALTIPRMELMAATVGARLIRLARDEFPLAARIILWSDSQCVLKWIRSTKLLPLFEENRVRQIKSVGCTEFRYVPTRENPADLLTRFNPDSQIATSSKWLHGPDFLARESEFWPEWTPEAPIPSDEEIWGVGVATALVTLAANVELRAPYGINVERFNSLGKLLRVTALCNRFVGIKPTECVRNVVENCELEFAMIMWVEYVQRSVYNEHFLKARVQHNPLRLVLDSTRTNIHGDVFTLPLPTTARFWFSSSKLRLTTRLAHSALEFSEKNPIILPDKHPFTRLLIKSFHFEAYHAGVLNTLARIRKQFFIVRGKAAVRQVISRCSVCQWMLAGPYRMPDFPALPAYRVNKSYPFTNCGLDGVGPFYIRTQQGQLPIYILQITCLVTRAIYLCALDDLSAESFLCRLREFGGRYTLPEIILCDNAKAFRSTSGVSQKVWLKMVCSHEIQNLSLESGRRITWKFIPALAPWTGGVYERLNAMIKRCFYFTIGEAKLTRLQFDAVLAEIQGILNSRPLCEIEEYDGFLTPNHFLQVPIFSRGPVIDKGGMPTKVQTDLLRAWRRGCKILDQFWKLWREQYLRSLIGSRKWRVKQGRVVSSVLPRIGEPVLIGENLPRHLWRVGRICELFRGQDGFVRSCLVKQLGGREVHRSVSQLYPYESQIEEIKPEGVVLGKLGGDSVCESGDDTLISGFVDNDNTKGEDPQEERAGGGDCDLASRRGRSIEALDLSDLLESKEEFGTPKAVSHVMNEGDGVNAPSEHSPGRVGQLAQAVPPADSFDEESPVTPRNSGPPPTPITPAVLREGFSFDDPRLGSGSVPGAQSLQTFTPILEKEYRRAALEARQRLFNLVPSRPKLGPTRAPGGGVSSKDEI